ncbi:MAG: pyridoxamine 5'-phosphate oxidase family protein [Deferribacteres bacterium]|nr:pyridoxamine 5'-phosphate oxidase family protein [candidate division KSB1 bacterium]MCB9502893.1 pyridoxamine 5'-phosphate oxidase family protein [Deferribacteres bacterium]
MGKNSITGNFPEIRRRDRALDRESALNLLRQGQIGVLSTVDDKNQPYGVPVNYAVLHDTIYIHCAKSGHKLDNIRKNHKVSFCVVGSHELKPEQFSTNYESVIVFGSAEIIESEAKRIPLKTLIDQLIPQMAPFGDDYIDKHFKRTAIIKIAIEHISGKRRDEK